MEDVLRQRVVGQDHVVSAISDAVRISRAGLQAPNRPVASFLFLGPTGVGKVRLYSYVPGEYGPNEVSDRAFKSACSVFVQR